MLNPWSKIAIKQSIRLHPLLFICGVILLSFFACKKSDDDQGAGQKDPGLFIVNRDGISWSPRLHHAVYASKWQQLYLFAEDDGGRFAMGIQLDSNQLVNNYAIRSNGSNVAELTKNGQTFASDFNLADIGGNFALTAFDTARKKLSGQLQVTMYTGNRTQKVSLSSSKIEDIPLEIDTGSYSGNYISCTVTGAASGKWEARDVDAQVTCISDHKYQQIELRFLSLLLNTRILTIYLPLENPGVLQPIYPREIPYLYCGSRKVTAKYEVRQAENYVSGAGSITITSMDTVARKLDASFNLTLKDTSGRGELLQITNGKLHISHYYRVP